MPAGVVVLVRHGESTWNAEDRFQGQADAPLNAAGQDQARRVAAALTALLADRIAPVRVVTSDLQRAGATAAAITAALGVPSATVDPRLREVRAGPWQGQRHEEIEAGWPGLYARWRRREDVPVGGDERPSEAGARVARAVRDHAAGIAGGIALVVVSHGTALRAGVAQLVGWQDGYARLGSLGNAHHVVLLPGDGPWQLVRWNVPPP